MLKIFDPFMAAQRTHAAWEALVPKRIAGLRYGPKGVHVLHPTKGWRLLSYKRLGL